MLMEYREKTIVRNSVAKRIGMQKISDGICLSLVFKLLAKHIEFIRRV